MKKTAIFLSLLFVSVVSYRCSEKSSNNIETVLEEEVNVSVEFTISSTAARKQSISSKRSVSSSKTTYLAEKAKSILISIRDEETKQFMKTISWIWFVWGMIF